MKRSLLLVAPLALLLPSCQTGDFATSGDFDPLTAPGSGRTPVVASQSGLRAGAYVRTSMETAFFSKRPKGDAVADKTLPSNTEVKVISDDGSYVKVELSSGEIGFVPTVLVGNQGDAPVSPNAIQVYPPVPGSGPPMIDPNAPTIPPVIDPDAPVISDEPPVPGDAPVEPVPLPPGNEEEGDPPVER